MKHSSIARSARLLPLSALTLTALIGASACRSGDIDSRAAESAPAPAAPSSGAGGAAQRAARARPIPPLAPEPWHVPVGPTLLLEPGKGMGPIRFGAHVETIERLIGEPCEEKRQESPHVLACRYSAQAVEFFLTDGALTSAHVHRLGRPFHNQEPKPDFGIFNGRFPGGAAIGMLMSAVQELLGKPKAVHPIKDPNPYDTIEVHDYDGFSLEYDRLGPDRVVLGGVVLTAPGAAKPASSKAKAGSQAKAR
ncbi:MAG TPA: hypothetical protein VFS67_09950 [Polyangiaceae bacterium]|nr:hypothetical protein [Polyangiaceae bacterium]